MEFDLGEAQPDMPVEFAGLLMRVAQQVENQDAPAGFEDFASGIQSLLGNGCMVQCLAEKGDIDRVGVDRRILDIAEPVFEI